VAPSATLALFATMPAVMATDGVWVPTGGVNELAQMLARLATESGASLRLNERVVSVSRRRVVTESATYEPDIVVSGLDAGVLDALRGKKVKRSRSASCSGIAVFAVLDEELPSEVVTHSVIMPDEPDDLYASLKNRTLPAQTMAFLNYYRAGHIYPNDRPTVAILLTAPPNGKSYDLTSEFVQREMTRISAVLGLPRQLADMIRDHAILHPEYFAGFGGLDGALYGEGHPWWRSGPFHSPTYSSRLSPWLWRVGASVHPGGGIPAVLGGALISTNRLLDTLR
jgi:phytoene desaturase